MPTEQWLTSTGINPDTTYGKILIRQRNAIKSSPLPDQPRHWNGSLGSHVIGVIRLAALNEITQEQAAAFLGLDGFQQAIQQRYQELSALAEQGHIAPNSPDSLELQALSRQLQLSSTEPTESGLTRPLFFTLVPETKPGLVDPLTEITRYVTEALQVPMDPHQFRLHARDTWFPWHHPRGLRDPQPDSLPVLSALAKRKFSPPSTLFHSGSLSFIGSCSLSVTMTLSKNSLNSRYILCSLSML